MSPQYSRRTQPHRLPCHSMQRFRLAFMPAYALTTLLIGIFAAPAFAQNIQISPASLSATVVKGQSTTLTLNLQKTGTAQHV